MLVQWQEKWLEGDETLRIKRAGSKMTGKVEIRDFCLRDWREGCE